MITQRSYRVLRADCRGIGGVLVSVDGTAVDLELLMEGEVVRHPRPGHAVGPGPGSVVVRAEGFLLDSTPSYDVQLAAYARAHGLPPPPPLGW